MSFLKSAGVTESLILIKMKPISKIITTANKINEKNYTNTGLKQKRLGFYLAKRDISRDYLGRVTKCEAEGIATLQK